MKIVCPTCEATYEVPESVLASKRTVKCARCGNNWVPGADWQPAGEDAAPAAAPADASPESPPNDPAPHAGTPPAPEPAASGEAGPRMAEPDLHAGLGEPGGEAVPHAPEPPGLSPSPVAPEFDLETPDMQVATALPDPEPRDIPPATARLQQIAAGAFGAPSREPESVAKPATRQPVAVWAVSLALLFALLLAAILFRTSIMQAWPASERVYTALGMAPPPGQDAP